MVKRNWTQQELERTVKEGDAAPTKNLANGNPATVFTDKLTGKPVVIDNLTGKVIQVGEKGFLYNNYRP